MTKKERLEQLDKTLAESININQVLRFNLDAAKLTADERYEDYEAEIARLKDVIENQRKELEAPNMAVFWLKEDQDQTIGELKTKLKEKDAQLGHLDHMLVASHLGTLDSFPTVAHAVRALVEFDLSVEKYFDKQRISEIEKIIDKDSWKIKE